MAGSLEDGADNGLSIVTMPAVDGRLQLCLLVTTPISQDCIFLGMAEDYRRIAAVMHAQIISAGRDAMNSGIVREVDDATVQEIRKRSGAGSKG